MNRWSEILLFLVDVLESHARQIGPILSYCTLWHFRLFAIIRSSPTQNHWSEPELCSQQKRHWITFHRTCDSSHAILPLILAKSLHRVTKIHWIVLWNDFDCPCQHLLHPQVVAVSTWRLSTTLTRTIYQVILTEYQSLMSPKFLFRFMFKRPQERLWLLPMLSKYTVLFTSMIIH